MGHGEGQRTVGTNSVIPEGAKRLSGIQKKGGYWIPDLGFASSGMTFVALVRIPHRKIPELPPILLPIHAYLCYAGMGRSLVAPADHILDFFFLAFQDSFNSTVGSIHNPANKFSFLSGSLGVGPEENPLYTARYEYVCSCFCH